MNTLRHQKFRFSNSFARAGLWPIFFAGMLVLHARAGPIIYTFTGVGSGSVNGTAFNNARFTIEAFADTANVGRYIIPDQPDLFVLSSEFPPPQSTSRESG